MTGQWVDIEFDCLPLRSVTRLDVPVDASPVYEQFVLRVKEAMNKHGSHNTYYLHHGTCTYHLTNNSERGSVTFVKPVLIEFPRNLLCCHRPSTQNKDNTHTAGKKRESQ